MPTKPWYTSKTVWSDIITAVVGAAFAIGNSIGFDIGHNHYVGVLLGILAAMGLYGRMAATTKLTT